MEAVSAKLAHMEAWRRSLRAHGLLREEVLAAIGPSSRGVSISKEGFELVRRLSPTHDPQRRVR